MVLSKSSLQALIERQAKLRELVEALRRDRELSYDLLTVALHELASEQGVRDRQAFARHWIASKRRAWARETSLPFGHERGGESSNGR